MYPEYVTPNCGGCSRGSLRKCSVLCYPFHHSCKSGVNDWSPVNCHIQTVIININCHGQVMYPPVTYNYLIPTCCIRFRLIIALTRFDVSSWPSSGSLYIYAAIFVNLFGRCFTCIIKIKIKY